MSQLTWSVVALVLFLAALPLLSFGTDAAQVVLWGAGLGLAGVAALIPPVLRFVPLSKASDSLGGD